MPQLHVRPLPHSCLSLLASPTSLVKFPAVLQCRSTLAHPRSKLDLPEPPILKGWNDCPESVGDIVDKQHCMQEQVEGEHLTMPPFWRGPQWAPHAHWFGLLVGLPSLVTCCTH